MNKYSLSFKRLFLPIVWTLVLTSLSSAEAPTAGKTAGAAATRIDKVNYILGTQTIGVKYQFTNETNLVETARRIREMGSNLLKFSMEDRSCGVQYNLPAREDIRTLVDLATKEPSVKAVLDMPFAYYMIWAYPFGTSGSEFFDGLTEKESARAYEELHDLAKHLLTTYRGTGKIFFLGHWEGDWIFRGRLKDMYNGNSPESPSPESIQGMRDWLNVRQKAIDDAKREVPAEGVYLYNYVEVNLVQRGLNGLTCLVNDVLPHTNVDFVSYSSYDITIPNKGNVSQPLRQALDYIESKLPPKPGIRGKRVFIGEFGFTMKDATTPEQQDAYSRDVCRVALEWGCPFVLYWQMYCNEIANGKHRGFWLIDDQNRKQPFYHTLENYYSQIKQFVSDFQTKHGRPPTDAEIRQRGIEFFQGQQGNSKP